MGEYNPTAIIPEKFFYVDLESVEGTILKSYREEKKISAPSRAQRLAQKGDIFFQAVRPYQKNNYLYDFNRNDFVFSTGYIQIRPNIDSWFLLSVVQKQSFIDKVMERSTGTSYPAINASDFQKIEIYLPSSLIEQKAIGEFFKQLDSTIDFHQRTQNKYQNLKIAYLEKLFSNKSHAWVQRTVNDCFSERVERSNEGELISVTMKSGVVKADTLDRKDNSSNDKSNYKKVVKGDIAYNSMRMWQGASGVSEYSGILSPAYTVLIPNTDISPVFFAYQFKLETMLAKFRANSQGLTSDTWNLKFPLIKDIQVNLPSLAEQQAIGDFFRQLDDTIATHQRELLKYQKLKEILLKKMFV